jgi:dihydrofolate reductase
MNVTMFMAMSVNGYIADDEGKEDFLSHDGWDVFVELAEKAGAFIIGRKTYEVVLQNYEGFGFKDVHADRIIVTSDMSFDTPEGYIVAHSPKEALTLAESLSHEEVILTGGAGLNSSFIAEDLINQVIINVEPAIIGGGTTLFAPSDFARRLQFREVKHRGNGVLQLHYEMGEEIK